MNIEIANRLVNLRKSNNLSQEALAEKLGISRQAVSKWERAEASPDTDNLILLARLYKVSLDELLQTEEEIPMPELTEVKESAQEDASVSEAEVRNEMPGDAGTENIIIASEQGKANDDTFDESDEEEGYIGSYFIPISVIITIAYIFIGNVFGAWHPGWLLFLLIPIWNSLASAVRAENANRFAYPVLVVLIYLCLGFFWGTWHPGWIIYLTVPLYYWAVSYVRVIKRRKKRNMGRYLNNSRKGGSTDEEK